MKVLVAPLEFKGTLTARQAAEAIAAGVRAARPGWQLDLLPLSDGGPGMVEAVVAATGGVVRVSRVEDPLGRPVDARWGALPDGTAVIEMAAASGLSLLGDDERDPLRTSTFGTGQLLRAALEEGHRRILIGAGGSATNDGGAGALMALGCVLRDETGTPLGRGGGALAKVNSLDVTGVLQEVRETELIVATDVTAPLLGPQGASRVFGPQKGATPEIVVELERALTRFADVVAAARGKDLRDVPGAGAAGGFAFGLAAVLGARIAPGFDLIAHQCALAGRLQLVDVVLTGEGRLDAQTAMGKGPGRLAKRAGPKPTIALVGSVAGDLRQEANAFRKVIVVTPEGTPREDLARNAAKYLEQAAKNWAEAYPDK